MSLVIRALDASNPTEKVNKQISSYHHLCDEIQKMDLDLKQCRLDLQDSLSQLLSETKDTYMITNERGEFTPLYITFPLIDESIVVTPTTLFKVANKDAQIFDGWEELPSTLSNVTIKVEGMSHAGDAIIDGSVWLGAILMHDGLTVSVDHNISEVHIGQITFDSAGDMFSIPFEKADDVKLVECNGEVTLELTLLDDNDEPRDAGRVFYLTGMEVTPEMREASGPKLIYLISESINAGLIAFDKQMRENESA